MSEVGQDAGSLRRRLDLVERTMAEVGWSGRIARALADQMGVSKRSVYKYRQQVMADLAEAYKSEDPRHDRAEFLSRLRSFQTKAAAKGAFGSLASMMNVEARVLGIEKMASAVGGADEYRPLTDDEKARIAELATRH
jgi:hypothetical protein